MVLVVDDCEDIGRMVALLLEMEGIHCHFVTSAIEALRTLAEKLPTVIILDDYMPEMDGLEFLRLMRANPHYAMLPVIFHTAGDRTSRRDAAEKLGISAWVKKGSNTWPVMLAHIHAQLAFASTPVRQ